MIVDLTNSDSEEEEEYQPDPITFEEHIFDFAFHSNNLVAVGLINGQVQCYNYLNDSNKLCWNTSISKKSCRGVEFTDDGSHLFAISRDKSIQALDVSTGRVLYKIRKAHKHAINKLQIMGPHLVATGDDEGVVKIWDIRTCKAAQEYKMHEDFISDVTYNEAKSTLIAAGGDGLLSIYDIKKPTEPVLHSEQVEDELLSITIVNNGNQLVAGSQTGAFYFWDWNRWSATPDKWLGHPSSVDSICRLDQETVCTGGSDGLLRLVSISPTRKFQGVLGDHGEDFPIERVRLSLDERYLGSCGHDLQLRFWNVQFLFDESSGENKRGLEDDEQGQSLKRSKTRGQFFENL
ncbi:WD40 repeat-like protein [Backusella circina FSU 941]|nr:WD40 repeat-like protein [Backusella circina FSU 941]